MDEQKTISHQEHSRKLQVDPIRQYKYDLESKHKVDWGMQQIEDIQWNIQERYQEVLKRTVRVCKEERQGWIQTQTAER